MNPQPPWTWGGVGWGNNVHFRLQTHALSWGRALVGWGGVGQGNLLRCYALGSASRAPFLPSGLPESGKTDLPMWCLSRVLRLGRSAPQILQNGPLHRALCQLGCAPFCAPSLSAAPFFPLIGPSLLQRTFFSLYSVLWHLSPNVQVNYCLGF